MEQATRGHAPTAAELQAVIKKTLTSAAYQRFIALAVDNALQEAQRSQVAAGSVELLAHPADRRVEWMDSVSGYSLPGMTPGSGIHMYRGRSRERDGVWWGSETRVDATGVEWDRSLPKMVCNDFGDLVEVAA